MGKQEFYKAWQEFIAEYKEYFPSNPAIQGQKLMEKITTIKPIEYDKQHDTKNNHAFKIMEIVETRNNQKQHEFRNKLIETYGGKCIISNVKKPIEACHIIPFSKCENFDVDNGLLMNRNLHSLFDSFDISINPKTLCVELLDDKDDDYEIYNNKKITIPSHMLDNVKKNLEVHYEQFLNNKNKEK
jgi:hypothetical protein